jgi:putative SbcD/Mre11-related phosphoesterase
LSTVVSLQPGLEAHPSGALWLAKSRTLLIADLHLGYSWAQRRKGELGPLADERTRARVLAVTGEFSPGRLVFVGDVVHAPRPCPEERLWIEALLSQLAERAELIAVRGNHDRLFAREFAQSPVTTVESWSEDSLLAMHGDRLPGRPLDSGTLVLGHLHPSLIIHDAAGAGQRLPVFLANCRCIVLPAFSPFARGYNVADGLPEDLLAQFGDEDIEAYAASQKRVVRLGNLRRVLQLNF